MLLFFFFSSRRRHTRLQGDWSSDVCSSDLLVVRHGGAGGEEVERDPENHRSAEVVGRAVERVRRHVQEVVRQRRAVVIERSEERRVGKECRARWVQYKKKKEECV